MKCVRFNVATELRKLADGRKTKADVVTVLHMALDRHPAVQARFDRAFGIRMAVLAVVLLLTSFASAETIHITGNRRATDAEKLYKTSFNMNLVTGTIGAKRYTLEQLAAFGPYHFEVGTDYPVLKVTDHEVKIQVADKKGRTRTETLQVAGVEEQ